MSGRQVGRRNAAVGGFAMLLLAASAAGSAKAEELDGKLIRLCREFQVQEDELDRLSALTDDLPMRERETNPICAQVRAGVDRINELRSLISDLPARTPEGLRAKAQAALADFGGAEDEWPSDNSQWISWTLARDVLGRDA